MRVDACLLAVLVGTAACGDDGGNQATSGGTAPETTATASSEATAGTAASADVTGQGSAGLTGADSSSGGGGGSGLVVPCGDEGMGNPDEGVICFFDVENPEGEPAATLEHQLGQINGMQALYIRLTLAPWFADNTYGINAIGWPGDHKFKDLVGSDRAEIHLKNMAGESVMHFALDYIDEDDTTPSGYRAMGIWGGEGEMIEGDEMQVLASTTSLARNLNDRGYAEYVVDSPATDELYTPNPAAPLWDYRMVYEVWISLDAITEVPVEACIDFIHASPSKLDDNTVDVLPDECPPGWGCYLEDGCDPCEDTDPDWDLCDPTGGGTNIP